MSARHDEILHHIQEARILPTIPAVAMSILRLSRDARTSIEKLAETIEKDPALAGKTLRFANSSYYGASRPIVGLPQALIRIGIRGAKLLALSFSLVGATKRTSIVGFDFPGFWYRSLTTSVAARRIASRSVRKLGDEVFIGGLLAEIGCVILARVFPQEYRHIEKSVASGQNDRAVSERRMLSITHAEVSRMVLESWHLPPELVEAVGAHHDPTALQRDSEAFNIAVVIAAAGDLSDIIAHGSTHQRNRRLAAAFREYFSFDASHVDLLLRDLGPEIQDVSQMLGVPLPPVDRIQAEAKSEMLKLALNQVAEEPVADANG